MLKREVNEYDVLRSMGIGLLDAMAHDERCTLPYHVFDVLREWIALPHVASDKIIRQLIIDLNALGEKAE